MRVLISVLTGGMIGVVLCAAVFIFSALADGTDLIEALGYSLIVAVLGAFLGGVVGAIIGLGNLKTFGGGLVGLLVTLAVVGLYVFGFSGSGEYSYSLSESRVIIAGLTVPLILTGSLTAWTKNVVLSRTR